MNTHTHAYTHHTSHHAHHTIHITHITHITHTSHTSHITHHHITHHTSHIHITHTHHTHITHITHKQTTWCKPVANSVDASPTSHWLVQSPQVRQKHEIAHLSSRFWCNSPVVYILQIAASSLVCAKCYGERIVPSSWSSIQWRILAVLLHPLLLRHRWIFRVVEILLVGWLLVVRYQCQVIFSTTTNNNNNNKQTTTTANTEHTKHLLGIGSFAVINN